MARYTLATGAAAAHRLEVLHEIWGPGTRQTAISAGLSPGMKVADFGCGVGTVSDLYPKLLVARGLDYTLGRRVHQLVRDADFHELAVRFNQPAYFHGREQRAFEWSLEEAADALIGAGLCS